jgi:hypothetical protein
MLDSLQNNQIFSTVKIFISAPYKPGLDPLDTDIRTIIKSACPD